MKINWKFALGAFSAAAIAVFADCPDGARNTTPAEQAFESATLEALTALVPPAPAGWELRKQQVFKGGRTSVCKGTDVSHVVYSVSYDWVDGRKEMMARTSAMEKKTAEIRRMPVEMEAEYNEIGKQARGLRREAVKARALKNLEEVARLEGEAKVLEGKAAKIKQAHQAATLPKIMEVVKEFQAGEDTRKYNMSLLLAANATPSASTPADSAETVVAGSKKPAPGRLQVQNVLVRWTGAKEQLPLFQPLMDRAAAARLVQQ